MTTILQPDTLDLAAYMAETEPKQKVKSAHVFVQEMIDDLGVVRREKRAFLPWDKTHGLFHFRPGEVTLWAGVNGQGKSMLSGLCAMSLCTQGERVCIASFEMKPRRTLQRMMRQWTGQNAPEESEHDSGEVLEVFRDLYSQFQDWSKGVLWLYDQQGTVKTPLLVAVLRYCADQLKIQHFFIDSLMKCISDEDDYNAQKRFVDELTVIARETGMHIHLVHHMKKLSDESKLPDKMDVKGSGSITDQVDNLLMVWRNKPKERNVQAGKAVAENEPDAMLICEKQRNGEWEGRVQLWFDKASQQYLGAHDAQPLDMWNFPHRRTM
jgi:twinkle protein